MFRFLSLRLARHVVALCDSLRISALFSRRYVTFTSYPDLADSALTVFLHAITIKQSLPIVWLVKDVGFSRRRLEELSLGSELSRVFIVKKNSLRGVFTVLSSRVVFFTHGHFSFVERWNSTLFVNLWHGMPIKAIGMLDGKTKESVPLSSFVIASSEFFVPILAKAFGLPESRVPVTGLPRCDSLVSSPAARMKMRERLLGANWNSLLVWMPTYKLSVEGDVRNDAAGTRQTYLAEFLATCNELDAEGAARSMRVLVKVHPMDFLNYESLPAFKNVEIMTRSSAQPVADFYEILAASDGLISDVSSVVIDYAVTRRPIALVSGQEAYKRGLLFDPRAAFPNFFHAQKLSDCPEFLDAVVTRRVMNYDGALWSPSGGAAERVWRLSEDVACAS